MYNMQKCVLHEAVTRKIRLSFCYMLVESKYSEH